jgi:hypothetical protein
MPLHGLSKETPTPPLLEDLDVKEPLRKPTLSPMLPVARALRRSSGTLFLRRAPGGKQSPPCWRGDETCENARRGAQREEGGRSG